MHYLLTYFSLMDILVDKLRLHLGIHNFLFRIQPVISGKHVADPAAKRVIPRALHAKQLNAEKYRRHRAVRYTAEHSRHSQRSRKRRRKPQQRAHHTAECCASKKGRDNFTALEARSERHCCKKYFQQKSARFRLSVQSAPCLRRCNPLCQQGTSAQSPESRPRTPAAADSGNTACICLKPAPSPRRTGCSAKRSLSPKAPRTSRHST